MQNDDLIWQVINKDFCSFKVKTPGDDMCRNAYNVSGKCNRVSCPLANSNYGTVIQSDGLLFLCLKTVERAHLPRTMWQKIPLPLNVEQAKDVIEKEMKNVYKSHQIERCKRRAAKLNRMLDRMRRMELEVKEKLVPIKKKTERREAIREKKAEVAARLEDVIELELMRRLQQGVYGSLYKNEKFERNETETPRVQAYSTQRNYEGSGCVIVKHSTHISGTDILDAELLKGSSQAGDEATASLAAGAVGSLPKPAKDVEDLAVDWYTEDTRGSSPSCSVLHLRAEGPSPRKKACKRCGGFSMVKRNPVTKKQARFFDVEGVPDTGTIRESYEDSGELVHN